MSIFRVEKTNNYTVMSNYHLKEREMSLKSKGLLSLMLSLPDNWDYSIAGLVAICKENESAIKATLTELESFGYLKRNKIYPDKSESGRIEYEYIIYEQAVQKQELENQALENLELENHGQLSTNKLNTKKQITSKDVAGKNPSLIPVKSSKDKKISDIQTMRSMVSAFTEDATVRLKLLDYFNIRVKKGLTPIQWKIILEDLKSFTGNNVQAQTEKINGAIAGGYMQIIAAWEKNKKYDKPKTGFDNTAGRTAEAYVNLSEEEKSAFKQNLPKDKDGNLLKF